MLSAYLVWQVRTADYAAASRATQNTARLVADDVGKSFEELDILMKSVGRRSVDRFAAGPGQGSQLAEQLKSEMAELPFVARVLVADSGGRVILRGGPYSGIDGETTISDRPYFRKAAGGDRELMFEGPRQSRFGQEWVIILARRLEDAEGKFLGTVAASISTAAFTRLFATLDNVPRGSVGLWTDTGVLVARYTGDAGAESEVGAANLSDTVKALLRDHPDRDHETYVSVSAIDGVARFLAFQKLSHAPFLVIVGQPKSELDQSWRRLAVVLGLLCLAVTAVGLWAARRLHLSSARLTEQTRTLERRVAERTAEIEAKNQSLADERSRLIASERKFSEAMACAPNPMILFAPDGRLIEANAAFCDLLGYRLDELKTKDIPGLLAPDTPPDPDNLRRLAAGEVKAIRVARRVLHKDGRWVSMQSDTSIARTATGEVEYFISQCQDISARLAFEQRLQALLDSAVDGVHVLEADGAIVEFSQSFADMLRYSREELSLIHI